MSVRQPPKTIEPPSYAAWEPPARGWIESGFYVMALPMAMAVRVIFAPVVWMVRSRPRQ